ncbi:MAG: methyltransferase domain-containing protein [Candidatus Omnitrophica bacterium]|nr:methyltransferase domain-containing protein [Candidatus Omnitrophota bacterium]
MPIHTCRVCGRDFFKEPLLVYKNMPKAAQHFPEEASLKTESGVDLRVCQCSGCGLVQLSDEPVPYYKEVIRAAAFSETIKDFKAKQFAGFIQKYSLKGEKIIEIGCGRGEFLSLLQPFDVKVYGLEYSETSVKACVKNGLNVSRGYIDSSSKKLANGPFNAFLLLMFLEHMPEPNHVLKGITNNLTEGAVGLVEVPNFDMILRKKLFSEFISDHLLYFTKETLQTTMNLNGFEVVEYSQLRDDYVISVVVKKREKLNIAHFYDYQIRIEDEIKNFLGRFQDKRVAIWGAGHQALAIISLTKIADKIRYVIDSAPFKQGKYTPATHLPIVAPDTLRSEPVDAVIIMAASYSDEVAGIIRKQFSRNMAVAILRDFGLEIV